MNDVPYFLETRIRQALTRAHDVARVKGLALAFDVELFAADQTVQDLLGAPTSADEASGAGAGTPEGARAGQGVLAKLDDLLGRLQAAHDLGPDGADAPVGRAGRGSPRRR